MTETWAPPCGHYDRRPDDCYLCRLASESAAYAAFWQRLPSPPPAPGPGPKPPAAVAEGPSPNRAGLCARLGVVASNTDAAGNRIACDRRWLYACLAGRPDCRPAHDCGPGRCPLWEEGD
jgi:hypothetical protein